jgi:hypothetical protein
MSKDLDFLPWEEFHPEHMLEPGFSFTGFNGFHSGSSSAGQFSPPQAMNGQEQVQELEVSITKRVMLL